MPKQKLYNQQDLDIANFKKDIEYIKLELQNITEKLEKNYVERTEFEPIKRLVYGVVSLILTSVIIALLALVIIKQ